MAASASSDVTARIDAALRLGWSVSELRGRFRQRLADRRTLGEAALRRHNALPLQAERSPAERAIELKYAIASLARSLDLDVEAITLTGHGKEAAATRASDVLTAYSKELVERSGDDLAWPEAWRRFTYFLFAWDARIQDELCARSLGEAAAYQLGRGLADVSWALDPGAPDDEVASWAFLLGKDRVDALHRLLQRVSPQFDELTISSVRASLDAWAEVARAPRRRGQTNAPAMAEEQVKLWRDLLLDRIDPRTLISPNAVLREAPRLLFLTRPFLFELLVAIAGVALLAVAAAVLAGRGQAVLGAVAAVLGAFGVTAAGVRARLKDQARDLVSQMRRAVFMELAARAVTRLPDQGQR